MPQGLRVQVPPRAQISLSMIKFVLFDTDGMIIHREMRFSQRLSNELGIPMEKILPFFKNEFQPCLIGKADLRKELKKYLPIWSWNKSTDAFLQYWFESENQVSQEMLASVAELRKAGIKCFLDTNNEKYRVKYLLNELDLRKHFDGMFSSAEIGFMKQEKEFWQTIHNKLGSPDKTSVLCWDDEEIKLEAAKEFGFLTELYTSLNKYKNKINKYLNKN
jgi:putative hydrolase of the HAD superfamily